MEPPVVCVVEVPRGSRNKYEYDRELGGFRFDRFIATSVVFPGDYGFLRGTCTPAGEPLDCLALVSDPTFAGCLIELCPVALLCSEDEDGRDDTVVGVPLHDPNWSEVRDLDAVPEPLRREIEHFFAVYKDLDPRRHSRLLGWSDRAAALEAIARAAATAVAGAPAMAQAGG